MKQYLSAWMISAACGVALCTGLGRAQPLDDSGLAAPTETNLGEFTARVVHRLAILDLRAVASPKPRDFSIAQELLSISQELAPNDPEVVRRRIEAAWNAGQGDVVVALTRRLVELDPADTVAQLRLISSRIDRMQTSGERLAAYERFLGPAGRSLDASIRSRLALDAALLYREQGNERAFVDRLKDACRLDGTNKDAALLAYTYLHDRIPEPKGRVEILANLLYADLLDPRTHRSLRDEFAAGGAFKAAKRFHEDMLRIENKAGNPTPEGASVESFVLAWEVEGAQKSAGYLTKSIETRRAEIRNAAALDPKRLEGPTVMRAEDVRLDLEYEQVRALASAAAGDADGLAASMNDMAKTVADRITALGDVTRRPVNVTAEQAPDLAASTAVEHLIFRILLRQDADKARAEALQLAGHLAEQDTRRVDLQAWAAIASGDADTAIAVVNAASARSLWTEVALATASELKGDRAGAVSMYRGVSRTYAIHPLGAFSRWRISQLGGDPETAKISAELEAYAATIPPWIDSMATLPRLTQSFMVDLSKTQAKPLERVEAVVRLKNIASIPQGLGSGRSINSRLFFGPSLETGIRARGDVAAAEVFDVDRRLRLMPNEELFASVWPECGLVGWLQEVGAASPSRLRWRVLQGFESRNSGEKDLGPGCLEAATSTLSREALAESRLTAGKLQQRIATAVDDQIPAVLVAVLGKLLGGVPGGTPDPEAAGIASAVTKAYPGWSPAARLLAVSALPPVSVCPVLASFDEVARQDQDPRVLAVIAATRVASADAWLSAATSHADARVSRIATLHAERLASGGRTYAGAGVQATPVAAPPQP